MSFRRSRFIVYITRHGRAYVMKPDRDFVDLKLGLYHPSNWQLWRRGGHPKKGVLDWFAEHGFRLAEGPHEGLAVWSPSDSHDLLLAMRWG